MIKLTNLLRECDECGRNWNQGPDHEAPMAHNEIKDAITNASKIGSMIGEHDDLPGWVSAYITLAADYLHSVAEFMEGQSSQMQQPQEPTPGYAVYESKPSAGMTKKEKSAVATKAKAGKESCKSC
jgi:hypothetical protein